MNTGFIPSVDGTEDVFDVRENEQLPKEYSYMDDLPPVLNQGSDPICVPCSLSAWLNWKTNVSRGIVKDNGVMVYNLFDNAGGCNDGMKCKDAYDYMVEHGVKSKAGILKMSRYFSVRSWYSLRHAIVSNGPCVVVLPICNEHSETFWKGGHIKGYHAVAAVGYDENGFIIRNSWGESFGYKGHTHISNDDVQKCKEMWTFV